MYHRIITSDYYLLLVGMCRLDLPKIMYSTLAMSILVFLVCQKVNLFVVLCLTKVIKTKKAAYEI